MSRILGYSGDNFASENKINNLKMLIDMKKKFSEISLTAEKEVIVDWFNTILENKGISQRVSTQSNEERICDVLQLLNSMKIGFNDLLKVSSLDNQKTCGKPSQRDYNVDITFTLVKELVGYESPVLSIYFIVTGDSQYQWEHVIRPFKYSQLEEIRFETDFSTISYKGTTIYVHLFEKDDDCVITNKFEEGKITPKTLKI